MNILNDYIDWRIMKINPFTMITVVLSILILVVFLFIFCAPLKKMDEPTPDYKIDSFSLEGKSTITDIPYITRIFQDKTNNNICYIVTNTRYNNVSPAISCVKR